MNLGEFIGAAVLLTLMPGPDILFVVVQSISRGKRAGIVFASGLCTGLLVHVTAVALGVSALLMNFPWAFQLLKVAGAGYLFYLGVRTFMTRRENHFKVADQQVWPSKLYRKGILMNLLNPKVVLFFLAFFPRFVDPATEHPISQMFLLGAIFMVQAFLIFSSVAFLAGFLVRYLTQNPKIILGLNVIEACLYAAIGLSICFA